ncbi:MAG TPA: cation-translocating P-type ATPase [Planctomycetota bacterium]|nr:cation-translocating P-type ATPase [Planctomycetota bacterium]
MKGSPSPPGSSEEVRRGSRGLSGAGAARRLAEHGRNEIRREEGVPAWALLLQQFRGPLVGLLLGACVLSALLGEAADAVAIGAIVLLIGLVGFLQEHRAERALAALRSMTAPQARVLRDGRSAMVPAAEVVPGDALVLEAGDLVAADARLLEAHVLRCNEAALTGESAPVEKRLGPVPADAPLAERFDRVFLGTSVAAGSGLAEVFATGMETELGRVAHLLATTRQEPTPLQRQLARVGRTLLWLCLAVVALVGALGLARGLAPLDVLLSSVSLAVAAVPEGLAAVVTIALAVGVQRMAARNVLVRRLPAVETLGCATVICTDKTGTLTTGVMTVRDLWGPDPRALLFAAAACSDAELDASRMGGTGDPTEIALLRAASGRRIERRAIEEERPRTAVHPFDPDRKRMSVRRADGVLYVKGAVESVLSLCRERTPAASEANADMAERGLRVLAVAVGGGPEESDLRLLGLVGIADPPRTEAIEAVAAARRAGIRTVMITGDHPATARAIAREMGLLGSGDDPAEVVHARASPEEKIRIVRDWKSRGAVVAMTGDGVNDAPALREAHIGIAMGRAGTEVAREASDMVLADDNFASIVAAVREGRGIYDNIQKALVYLLAGNAGELAVMLGASIAGLPLPLLPLQLLWVNLVTDGLPALALVVDPTSPDALNRSPRRPGDPILGRAQWRQVLFTGAVQAATTLAAFGWALRARGLAEARNLAFTVLVFGELFRAFAARSPTRLFWEVGAFTNLRLLGVVLLSALVQLAIHHVSFTQDLFAIGTISGADCALSFALGLVPVSIVEGAKLVGRLLGRTGGTAREAA